MSKRTFSCRGDSVLVFCNNPQIKFDVTLDNFLVPYFLALFFFRFFFSFFGSNKSFYAPIKRILRMTFVHWLACVEWMAQDHRSLCLAARQCR